MLIIDRVLEVKMVAIRTGKRAVERHLRCMDTQKREDPAAAGPGKCTSDGRRARRAGGGGDTWQAAQMMSSM